MATFQTSTISDENYSTITINKNKILVPVYFQGKRYNFMLDTGSRGTSLSKKLNLSKELNLKFVTKAKYAGANRVFKETNIYRLPEIIVGNRIIKNIDVSEEDLQVEEWDGILGMDVFLRYPLYIDLIDKKMALLDVSKQLNYQVGIDFKNDKDILVKVKINGLYFENFLFDTGAGSSTCTYEIKNKTKLIEQKNKEIFMYDATGSIEKTFPLVVDNFCLEDVCKKNFELIPAKFHLLEKNIIEMEFLALIL